MSEHIEGVVPAESFEITDEAIEGFIDHGGEAPTFHPILQIWREVLKPARDELSAKVTPQWASRIVTSHIGLTFRDMEDFRDAYFGKLLELADMIDAEIATDDECLTYTTPEEDVEHNSGHYRNLLRDWQVRFMQWEIDWETTSSDAAIELAAISEVHKMFFGQTGLTQFLDNIKFVYTEADQQELAEVLNGLKEGR
jgi:hypothetical protein